LLNFGSIRFHCNCLKNFWELFLFSLLWFHDASPCIWIRRLVAHCNLFILWPNSFPRLLVSSWPSISLFLWDSFVPDFPLFSESISDSTGRYLFTRSLTQLIAQISMLMSQELGANVLSPNWLAPGRAQRVERLRVDRLGSVVSSTLSLKTSVLGINKCP